MMLSMIQRISWILQKKQQTYMAFKISTHSYKRIQNWWNLFWYNLILNCLWLRQFRISVSSLALKSNYIHFGHQLSSIFLSQMLKDANKKWPQKRFKNQSNQKGLVLIWYSKEIPILIWLVFDIEKIIWLWKICCLL